MANTDQVVQKSGNPVQAAKPVKPVVAGEKSSILKKWWLWLIVVLIVAGLIIWVV
tara:strand:- start:4366 stop:4530 length:165 start_codon:yes stop_codon:yes gene_type:complete